jgi:hypothetical protein
MNSLCRGAIFGVLVCGGMACKGIGGSGAADGSAADAPLSFPANSGLNAAGNDPAILAVVKAQIAACGTKWDAKTGWSDDCSKAFNDMKVDKKDATFVNLMEDPDAKVRELGVGGLDRFGYDYKTDKDLGTRVVAALEREPALPFNAELAYLVDNLDLKSVPVGDRIKALALNPKTPSDVRTTITVWWPQNTGPENTLGYDVVKANSTATDKKLHIGAIDGYAEFGETKHDEACAYWATNMTDADPEIASVAYGHITKGWTGVNAHDTESDWYSTGGGQRGEVECSQLDAAIALAESKAKAGKIDHDKYVYGCSAVAEDKKATPAQRKAAITALREIISNKANQNRYYAVQKLVEADPSEKSFVEKFKSDPDVASAVKEALAPKKK